MCGGYCLSRQREDEVFGVGRPQRLIHHMKKTWFTIQQVQRSVFALAEFSHFEKVISYLVLGNSQAILIDTGMGYESISHVVRQITRLPVRVLLTHTHWDHIGGACEFADISVFDEKNEIQRLNRGFTSTEISELHDVAVFEKPFKPKAYAVKGVRALAVHNTDVIYCDPWKFTIWHTPGHTPGSICIVEPSEGWLFTGDTLYPGPLYAFEDESNVDSYSSSIRYINEHIDIFRCIYPGHNEALSHPALITDAIHLFERIENNVQPDTVQDGKGVYAGTMLSVLVKDNVSTLVKM